MLNSDVAVVIPAYNESKQIVSTIQQLKPNFNKIIVVDDGSSDRLSTVLSSLNVVCLRHAVNLGQGAALQTGITYALLNQEIKYILTFDADGQHSVDYALKLMNEIKNKNLDIILGSRFLEKSNQISVPQKKKLVLKLGILFTRFDTGLKVTDTHNGLRIFNRIFAESLNIKHAGMAHASEILSHIKENDFTWSECPVKILYTDYSNRKGQSVFNAINIVTEIFHK